MNNQVKEMSHFSPCCQFGLWVGILAVTVYVKCSHPLPPSPPSISPSQTVFSVLEMALSEVLALCFLMFTGGQLGLWVGISAITVCELFDLIAQLMIYMCRGGGGKVEDEEDSVTQVKQISSE